VNDPDEFADNLLYRAAYGIAWRRLEADMYSMQGGRYRGTGAAKLCEMVARELGCDPGDPLVREGVEHALEGRQPRW
jgi:hypothetical protein